MREILFKAKRIDNSEWAEGSYAYAFNEDENCHVVGIMKECHYIVERGGNLLLIDKNTICQYTGLTDKDGSKIWENDIVKCQDVLGKINWNETHASFVILADENGNMRYYYIDECLAKDDIEVIGNIFDNPELIKEE